MRGMNAIHDAISKTGGPSSVAKMLGVSVQAVCFWRDGKRTFPAALCPKFERETNGAVRCEELRPDFDWACLRQSASAQSHKEAA